ncbi:ankyrin repeat domain-containing protein [Legionella worsleiensis]|uniref:Ankyrin repeat protein n=1 Tax=Legionella worsleiensis TaxID=45076 RepID=A0A0W1AFZ8_9GAMM|nr:ankyrin repeat domain-containing protein [Legionella worsleiensis]KTD80180.1 hypothetical protein Lwor_1088 [Legionella worsleiensis]STY31785.1 Uncharacterised protein [Legionella worsleiensis]
MSAHTVDELIKKDRQDLISLVAQNPSLLLEQDSDGKTLLHCAVLDARMGNSWVLSLEPYITKEALSVTDNRGNTPIHTAALYANNLRIYVQVMPLYLKKAAIFRLDVNLVNHAGETPLSLTEVCDRIWRQNCSAPRQDAKGYFMRAMTIDSASLSPQEHFEYYIRLLEEYIETRKKEPEYFTFFRRWRGMTRTVKLEAAEKLLAFLNGDTSITFSQNQQDALNDGRLKAIYSQINIDKTNWSFKDSPNSFS